VAVNPNFTTTAGVALTGALLVGGVRWAPYVLFPTVCVAIIGGLTSAYFLLTSSTDAGSGEHLHELGQPCPVGRHPIQSLEFA
jgi:hypothetical protein